MARHLIFAPSEIVQSPNWSACPKSPLPPTTQRLPLEVLECIIEFLGFSLGTEEWRIGYRLEILCQCALVCRSVITKSRVHLYKVVHLNSKRNATSFMATIISSPHFGNYVQGLGIDLNSKHSDWIYSAHQILPPLLPNLHRLDYYYLPGLHPIFFIPSPRFRAITSLGLFYCRSMTFREIVRLLNGFPNLETLDVYCKWASPSPFYCRTKSQQGRSHSSFYLNSIDSKLSKSQIDDLVHWLSKKRTSLFGTLSIRCPYLTIQSRYLGDLLCRSTTTLTSLDLLLDGHHEKLSNVTAIDATWLPVFALCENLGNIRIGLPNPDSAHWFLEPLLSNLPNSLCRIALYFRKSVSSLAIFPPKTTKDKEIPKTLENTLTSSKFPKVAYVEIRWDEQTTTNQFEDNLIKMHQQGTFKESLPSIYERGILWCGHYWKELVYPVEEPILTLAGKGDREAWRRLSRDCLFRYAQH